MRGREGGREGREGGSEGEGGREGEGREGKREFYIFLTNICMCILRNCCVLDYYSYLC